MKRILLPLLLGILFMTFQATLLTAPFIQRIRPDIMLILTIYLGLSYPPISGGILAFVMGYLLDLFSGNSFGLYTLSRPLLFFVVQLLKNRFYLEGYLSKFLFVLIFALLEGFLVLFLLTALNPNPLNNLYFLFFTLFLPQSFFTGLLFPLLFSFFKKGSFLLFNQYEMGIKERG
jgi:rod shape-determining protein MreD